MKKERAVSAQSKKTLKTFNLDEQTYNQFSQHCKTNGISMSKKIENFIKDELSKINSPVKEDIKEKAKEQIPQFKEEIKQIKEHSFSKYC